MFRTNYFQTPPVVKNLIIANCIALLATELLPIGGDIIGYLALFNPESPFFHSFQVVSYMFLHGGLEHLFFNMFALWMFGRTLEAEIGSKRFLTYYLVCGIGAALLQLGVGWLEYDHAVRTYGAMSLQARALLQVPTVGASGAVFGLLLAFGVMHPNAVIMLMFPPIPMKAKWFVVIYGLIELFFGMSGRQPGVAHFAHLGGMLWGWLLLIYWKRRREIYY
ncbi:MAG: rhomboid family intramembrane serine protease [Rikenellaceae bacterium]|nr:rhomboid family intramembrane serine protease [Rikenellaceae bacterium]